MAALSLAFGILSIIIALFGSFAGISWAGIALGIAGIIIAAVERKNNNPETKSLATAGLVCSIIGTAFGVIMWVACLACVGCANHAAKEIFS